jgi:dihydroneopterin aldolase
MGSHAYEREEDQEIILDVEMRVDITECVQTDSLVDTLDYTKVAQVCRELAQERRYHLLETFAYEILHALNDAFSPLWLRVHVKKKHALRLAKAVSFELEFAK